MAFPISLQSVTRLISDAVEPALADTGVSPGVYTSADITVNSEGRITVAANGGGGGTMSSFDATGDSGTIQTITDGNTLKILGGTALSSVADATDTITLNLDDTGVAAGAYNSANITVDLQGRITSAAAGAKGTNGQILIGVAGSDAVLGNITLGSKGGLNITNGPGTISVEADVSQGTTSGCYAIYWNTTTKTFWYEQKSSS